MIGFAIWLYLSGASFMGVFMVKTFGPFKGFQLVSMVVAMCLFWFVVCPVMTILSAGSWARMRFERKV